MTMKLNKRQLNQAVTAEDKRKQKQLCVDMQDKPEEEEFMKRLVLRDEATFHTNG